MARAISASSAPPKICRRQSGEKPDRQAAGSAEQPDQQAGAQAIHDGAEQIAAGTIRSKPGDEPAIGREMPRCDLGVGDRHETKIIGVLGRDPGCEQRGEREDHQNDDGGGARPATISRRRRVVPDIPR